MPNELTQRDEHFDGNDAWVQANGTMSAIISDMTEHTISPTDLETGSVSDLATLIESVKAGDRRAFEVLYDATVRRIFSLALRITQQQELAEEVVSDVYLQVWQQADNYSPERGKVIAWLCILCRSRALDALRRNSTLNRQATADLDPVTEQKELHRPPDLLSAIEQGSAIHAALGRLSEQQRQLVALAYFRGYTHSEIARFMEIPIGTVKSNLHRAMIKLKELMSNGEYVVGGSDE